MNKVSGYSLVFLTFLVASCRDSGKAEAGDCVPHGDDIPRVVGVTQEVGHEEIEDLIARVDSGDADAAYKLYDLFTYSYQDYGIAYYWALKAHDLGHPKANMEFVKSAENNIRAKLLHVEDSKEGIREGSDLLPKGAPP